MATRLEAGTLARVSEALERFNAAMTGRLPGVFGMRLVAIEHGLAEARLDLKPEHLAPNDFLHAGTVITLADSCCGMGCLASLPEGAVGFTTIELKTNFLATAKEGALRCRAELAHGGSRTQVWDATVSREGDERVIALFRCTQFILPGDDPRTERQRRQSKALERAKNEMNEGRD
jgi:1,4-dihydroxy-2-naphthoyl-CoA hydrolase